jgi:hypothetical protein
MHMIKKGQVDTSNQCVDAEVNFIKPVIWNSCLNMDVV